MIGHTRYSFLFILLLLLLCVSMVILSSIFLVRIVVIWGEHEVVSVRMVLLLARDTAAVRVVFTGLVGLVLLVRRWKSGRVEGGGWKVEGGG